MTRTVINAHVVCTGERAKGWPYNTLTTPDFKIKDTQKSKPVDSSKSHFGLLKAPKIPIET